MKLALWFKTLLTLAGPVLLLALVVGLILLAWPTPASAAGPVVTIAEDEAGDCATGTGCSLREAIAAADDGDTITFAGNYTIYLTGDLIITKELTIDGSGHTVTISGDTGGNGTADVRVFSIGSSSVATLTHLNIVSGTTGSGSTCPDYCGGGVYIATGGTLTVLTSTLTGNSAGYRGGGLYNDGGTLTVKASTFAGNSVTYFGGGLYNNGGTVTVQTSTFSGNRTTYTPYGDYGGGGIYNTGGMTIENCTISGNSAPSNSGGGIYNDSPGKVLKVEASTISGNSADYGGGIYNKNGTLDLVQTIIANSSSGHDCLITGGWESSLDSLFEDTGEYACNDTGAYHTILGVDPLLSPLGDYGGATQTFALLPGSPAINFVQWSDCPATDQRGVSRPVGTTCDIGAFESRGFNLAVSGGNNQSTPLNTAFTEPLSVTVNSVDGAPVGLGVVITYTAPATPGSASLSTTSLTATTTAAGTAEVNVTANEVAGSYTVVVTAPWASAPVNFNLTNLAPYPTYLPVILK